MISNLNLLQPTKIVIHLIAIVLILFFFFSFSLNNQSRVFAQTSSTTSFALQIDPNAPFTAQGGTFNVQLVARSDIELANLFSAKITFPANELQVTSIDDTDNTFITQEVEHTFNNTTGTISIVGGVAGGMKTNSTDLPPNMATITFQRTGSDPVTLSFTPSTQSDVNETAIFSNATNQNILVLSPDFSLSDSDIPSPTPTPTPTSGPTSTPTPCQSNCNSAPSNPPTGGGDTSSSTTTSSSGIVGDIDGNGVVNIFDLSTLLIDWGTSNPQADLNHDGIVNIFDLSILLINWTR